MYPVARMDTLRVRLDITVKPELSLVDLKGEVDLGCWDGLLLIAIPDGTCASKYELGTTQVDGLPHTSMIPTTVMCMADDTDFRAHLDLRGQERK
jgi:hypothetical protein